MSDALLSAVEDGLAAVEKKFDAKFDSLCNEIGLKMAAAPDSYGKSDPLAKLMGDAGLVALKNRQTRNARIALDGDLRSVMTKSTLVADVGGSDGPGYSIQPQRLPGLHGVAQRELSLLTALPTIRVTSGSLTFNRLDGYSNAADYQSEQGDAKAEASVPSELVTANIATIAHFVPVAEQVLADEPVLRQQIDGLLTYGLRQKLEGELVNGAGGTGEIAGLLDAGNFTAFSESTSELSLPDLVNEMSAALIVAGWQPGLVIVHPTDWATARAERADSSGVYMAGSWAQPAPPSIWSLPVVLSAAVPQGNAIVLDPSQVAILDRQQATVDVGYSGDGFTRNVVTIRAECRAGLAVFAPSAVLYGSM